jgi:hypothetical protein
MEELKFEDLVGEAKEFEIMGKKVEIPPLKTKDLKLFIGLENPQTKPKAMIDIFVKTLRKIFPDKNENEIKNLPLSVLVNFFEKILEANDLKHEVDNEDFQKAIQNLKS